MKSLKRYMFLGTFFQGKTEDNENTTTKNHLVEKILIGVIVLIIILILILSLKTKDIESGPQPQDAVKAAINKIYQLMLSITNFFIKSLVL